MIPGSGGSAGGGHGNPLQCSCLESPANRGAWWAMISGVTESDMTEATKAGHSVGSFTCGLINSGDVLNNIWRTNEQTLP